MDGVDGWRWSVEWWISLSALPAAAAPALPAPRRAATYLQPYPPNASHLPFAFFPFSRLRRCTHLPPPARARAAPRLPAPALRCLPTHCLPARCLPAACAPLARCRALPAHVLPACRAGISLFKRRTNLAVLLPNPCRINSCCGGGTYLLTCRRFAKRQRTSVTWP